MGKSETRFGSLAERAYLTLRDRIIQRELLPRERIVAQEVAAALGMSRIPVRDALRQLASEHLVVGGDRRGWSVASFSAEDIAEICVVRKALEGASMRRCAERATPEDVAELYRLARQIDERPPVEPIRGMEDEKRFHLRMAEIADCGRLRQEVERWLNPLLVSYAVILRASAWTRPRHDVLVDAIATGDPDLAEKAMREHIQRHMPAGRSTQARPPKAREASVLEGDA